MADGALWVDAGDNMVADMSESKDVYTAFDDHVEEIETLKKRIEELEAERDDYKTRWEKIMITEQEKENVRALEDAIERLEGLRIEDVQVDIDEALEHLQEAIDAYKEIISNEPNG